MLPYDKVKKTLLGVLFTMLVVSLVITALVFTAPQFASAAKPNETPPPGTDSIGLGCVCEVIVSNFFYDCCHEAYWHSENGGWIECRNGWFHDEYGRTPPNHGYLGQSCSLY